MRWSTLRISPSELMSSRQAVPLVRSRSRVVPCRWIMRRITGVGEQRAHHFAVGTEDGLFRVLGAEAGSQVLVVGVGADSVPQLDRWIEELGEWTDGLDTSGCWAADESLDRPDGQHGGQVGGDLLAPRRQWAAGVVDRPLALGQGGSVTDDHQLHGRTLWAHEWCCEVSGE